MPSLSMGIPSKRNIGRVTVRSFPGMMFRRLASEVLWFLKESLWSITTEDTLNERLCSFSLGSLLELNDDDSITELCSVVWLRD